MGDRARSEHVGGFLVRPQAAPGGVADAAGARELPVDDLADEPGLDPAGADGVFARRRRRERVSAAFEWLEPGHQVGARGLAEAGADVADVDEIARLGVVGAEQQAAEGAGEAALPGTPAADDDFLRADQRVLEPGVRPLPGHVRRAAQLRDDAFVAGGRGVGQEVRRRAAVGGQLVEGDGADHRDAVRIGHRQGGQQAAAFVVRFLEQVAVAEAQQVEGEEPDRDVVEVPGLRGALVPDPAAAAFLHELEVDAAVFAVDDDLAVEVGGPAVERGGEDPGELGELGGEVDVVAAGEDRGAVRGDPHRRAVAVQLVLVRPFGAAAQPAAVGLGEHRLDPRRGAGRVVSSHAGPPSVLPRR